MLLFRLLLMSEFGKITHRDNVCCFRATLNLLFSLKGQHYQETYPMLGKDKVSLDKDVEIFSMILTHSERQAQVIGQLCV